MWPARAWLTALMTSTPVGPPAPPRRGGRPPGRPPPPRPAPPRPAQCPPRRSWGGPRCGFRLVRARDHRRREDADELEVVGPVGLGGVKCPWRDVDDHARLHLGGAVGGHDSAAAGGAVDRLLLGRVDVTLGPGAGRKHGDAHVDLPRRAVVGTEVRVPGAAGEGDDLGLGARDALDHRKPLGPARPGSMSEQSIIENTRGAASGQVKWGPPPEGRRTPVVCGQTGVGPFTTRTRWAGSRARRSPWSRSAR